MFVALVIRVQSVCTLLFCHLWPFRLNHIFLHYLINGTIFGKKFIEYKMCVLIFFTNLSEAFLIPRRIQRFIAMRLHVKYPLFLSYIDEHLIYSTGFRNVLKQDFMKIRPVRAEFHADGWSDRHNEANSHFS